MRRAALAAGVLVLAGAALLAWLLVPYGSASELAEDTPYMVPPGATLTSVTRDLSERGVIGDADAMLLRARLLAGNAPIRAGEFLLPAGASYRQIVEVLQSGEAIRRSVTIPEGLPAVLVQERLMAEPLLTGEVGVPPEGSVLPETYDFERGESRQAVLVRMQAAMDEAVAELWPGRSGRSAAGTPQEAVILASLVEKETAKPEERRMIAGVMSNRLERGMRLDIDATTIYPITQGRPLGRMIRRSELDDPNPYNTRAVVGLPPGPITNPGRESIAAVLNPAETNALYYVADGSGGHAFARTYAEHLANVTRWRAFREREGI
jgi:UPF0755 protein